MAGFRTRRDGRVFPVKEARNSVVTPVMIEENPRFVSRRALVDRVLGKIEKQVTPRLPEGKMSTFGENDEEQQLISMVRALPRRRLENLDKRLNKQKINTIKRF